jgi:F-type H+-transporting ATPase subunit b
MEKLISEFSVGLFFWQLVIFVALIFLLRKFAWKPILNSIREREDSINNALNAAEDARKQMDALKSDNEKLLQQARLERDAMLKEAKEMKEDIISTAKKSADDEARRIVASANESIESAKLKALNELKTQVAELSVDLAEKVLRRKMNDRAEQEAFVNENLKSITLN